MRVLTFGTFDHLHPGHIAYLEYAESKGDLTVIVARDSTVKKIKGRSSLQSEVDRAAAIAEKFPNATVILGDENDYLRPVIAAKPNLIVLGYDQKLPPGVAEADFPCPIERAPAHEPETYKSSKLRRD